MSNDKKGKKVSKKFSVDFSNVVGNKSTVAPPKEPSKTIPQPKRQPNKQKSEPSGIMLSIPTEQSGQWIDRDLADCSGEEFAAWMFSVFPTPTNEQDIIQFNKGMVRLEVFKKIVNFHRVLHISGTGKPKDPPVA